MRVALRVQGSVPTKPSVNSCTRITHPLRHTSAIHRHLRAACRTPRALWCALLETVLEFARDELQRPHAAGTGCLSPLGLLSPVVYMVVLVSDLSSQNHYIRNGYGGRDIVV